MTYEQEAPAQAAKDVLTQPVSEQSSRLGKVRALLRASALQPVAERRIPSGTIPKAWGKSRRWLRVVRELARRHTLFMVLVVMPTLLASIYYGLIAANQYVSVAQFIVRGQRQVSPSLLNSLLQGAGLSLAQEDTYAVQDFVKSRDAMYAANKALDLRKVYGRPSIDLIAKFPGVLYPRGTLEDLFEYFKGKVEVYDSNTGITTLKVYAFTANDAYRIARNLISNSEKLVNHLNTRAETDELSTAHHEVNVAEAKLAHIQQEVAAFRDQYGMLSPGSSSKPILEISGRLQMDLAATEAQIAHLEASLPGSPELPVLRSRVAALQAQIAKEQARIAGSRRSIVPKIARYQTLELEQTLVEKELAAATVSLERARQRVEQQQLFLEQIVKPDLPDEAMYPKRLEDILATFLLSLVLWGIASIVVAGVREHHD